MPLVAVKTPILRLNIVVWQNARPHATRPSSGYSPTRAWASLSYVDYWSALLLSFFHLTVLSKGISVELC